MRICIDIDGTISTTGEIVLEKKAEYLKEHNEISEEEFDNTEAIQEDFYIKYMKDIVREVGLKKGFTDAFSKMRGNNQIAIVTARSDMYVSNMEEITKAWLEKNNISYDKYYGGCYMDGKIEACLDFGADVIIDDDIKNYNTLKEAGIKTLLFDDNQRHLDISDRVDSWDEVYNVLFGVKDKNIKSLE